MAITNQERVGKAMDLLRAGLAPFVEREFKSQHQDKAVEAARRYFGVSAAQLSAEQAARLAAMAPSPRRFERNPDSAYLGGRVATILARMPAAAVP